MKYSIIIPTYNKCDELLRPCLESILKYTTVNAPDESEIIIVANGCIDNTKEYVKSVQQHFHNVILVEREEAIGYTRAINLGAAYAKGKYLVLLNNDTVLLPQNYNEWLHILEAPFKQDDKVAVTGPMKVPNDGTGLPFLIFFCVMISKEMFSTLDGLDVTFSPGYGEDTDFCLKAEKLGYKVVQVPRDSQLYYADKRMTGDFPIYHAGNQTFKDYPDADLITRNNQILIARYSPEIEEPFETSKRTFAEWKARNTTERDKKIIDNYVPKKGNAENLEEFFNVPSVNIERAKQCDGYMADSELEWLATQASKIKEGGVIIEVGSWHGKSSRAIADNMNPGVVLYCVDHWRGSKIERDNNHQSAAWEDGDHAYLEFSENLHDHLFANSVIPIRLSSVNAARFLKQHGIIADMVFIDAGHTKEEVKEDIEVWLPLTRGMICGHDMYHLDHTWPGVGEAVHEIFGDNVAQAPDTSIWVASSQGRKPATVKPSIIDCFPFNDELDILEIRFNELYDVVDRFVIVEAKLTHGGKKKGLNFHNNLGRFEKFLNKVTYIVIEAEEFPSLDSWSIERYQRDAIMRALTGCKDEDIIIISDCDEIPRAEVIKNYRIEKGLCCVSQRLYYYNLNCQSDEPWNWLRILPYSIMKSMTPCEVRYTPNYKFGDQQIGEGGWHFSYIGDADRVISKIQDSAHQEYNRPEIKDKERIQKIIEEGKDLYDRGISFHFAPINDMYPKYILDNIETFKQKGLVK